MSYLTLAKAQVLARAPLAEPVVEREVALAVVIEAAPGLRQSPTWQPASTL